MRQPEEDPGLPTGASADATRDLLLAQALNACITAERRLPGSAQEIIARQPIWARADLRRLVDVALSLDAAASNAIMSSEFRVAARARLMRRVGGDASRGPSAQPERSGSTPSAPPQLRVVAPRPGRPRRKRKTFCRVALALLTAALAAGAAVTASASARPGEPLYGLKVARDELGVRLAPDGRTLALALLHQADARLDETARLLEQGRPSEPSAIAQ